MPELFLSPSTQSWNPYVNTGNEQYWMNRIADAMEPYLHAAGINVTRNNPQGTVQTSVRQSNMGNYDFHLALHSNAAPGDKAGQVRYSIVFYYPTSANGLRMANILVDNFREIYPLPDEVRAEASTTITELRRTRAPVAFFEIAFHDNPEDAAWIVNNVEEIAANISESVTEYFGLPFLQPQLERTGIVTLDSGTLNLREGPEVTAPIVRTIPNRARISVLGQFEDWYSAEYRDQYGWVNSNYIRF